MEDKVRNQPVSNQTLSKILTFILKCLILVCWCKAAYPANIQLICLVKQLETTSPPSFYTYLDHIALVDWNATLIIIVFAWALSAVFGRYYPKLCCWNVVLWQVTTPFSWHLINTPTESMLKPRNTSSVLRKIFYSSPEAVSGHWICQRLSVGLVRWFILVSFLWKIRIPA